MALLFGCGVAMNGAVAASAPAAMNAQNPAPIYPEESKRYGEDGTVILKVLIRKDGRADQVLIQQSSGYERLDLSAVQAIKKWIFSPAIKDGNPIDEWYQIPIKFVLPDSKK